MYSKEIATYLNTNGGKDILREHKNSRTLSERMRKKLVNLSVDLMVERFGLYPTAAQKTIVAIAVVELFPSFKTRESSDGIVSSIFLTSQINNL